MAGGAVKTRRIGVLLSLFTPGGIPHHLAGQPVSLLLRLISWPIDRQPGMDTVGCYLRLPLPGCLQVLHLPMTQGAMKPAQRFG